MSLQASIRKFRVLPGMITWGCFVLILGVFGGYTFLLTEKEQTTQELLRSELRHLREENRQLTEQNKQIEQTSGVETEELEMPQKENSFSGDLAVEPSSQRSFMYTVRKGDTIWDIAALYNVDVNALMRWNNLTPRSRIFPGDELTIILEE